MTDLAFVDCETTGLDPERHDVWEIAVIRRDAEYARAGIVDYDREHLWQIRVPLGDADPKALEINRYHQRFIVPNNNEAAEINPDGTLFQRLLLPELLFDVQEAVSAAVLVGSNPAFDAAFLRELFQANGRKIGWHYRTVDVATLAAGYLHGRYGKALEDGELEAVTQPFSSRNLSRAVGVDPPGPDVAHTALGDARWVRDVYDAVTAGSAS